MTALNAGDQRDGGGSPKVHLRAMCGSSQQSGCAVEGTAFMLGKSHEKTDFRYRVRMGAVCTALGWFFEFKIDK